MNKKPNNLVDYEWQQYQKRKDKAVMLSVTVATLAIIGAVTVGFLAYTGAQAHFNAKFESDRAGHARNRADAQVINARMEALNEGKMETLPLVLKRVQDFINE